MGPRSFAYCLDRLTAALDGFEQAAAEVDRIEQEELAHLRAKRDAHPNLIGGRQTPIEYDLPVALKLDHVYNQAAAKKGSRRDQAIMWGIAALVAAAAGGQPDVNDHPTPDSR